MQKSVGKVAYLWLKARRGRFALYLGMMVIYYIIPFLYHLPVHVIMYSQILVGSIGIVVAGADFIKYYKQWERLYYIEQDDLEIWQKELPAKEELIKAYEDKIKQMQDRQRTLETQQKIILTEMKDYYTLWAHQIKVPIAAMHLLLDDEPLEKGQVELELFKVEQYTEMVLQYLRVESMASDMVLKECDLYSLVKEVVKKYAIYFIQKKISLNLEPFETLVVTDEKWLSFVIEQLLSNSLKYTATGCITIRYEGGACGKLIISDTGIGISQQDLPRVFEKGFTGYNGRMDKRSTGIGLYLCKKITSGLAHTLEVESKLKEGTKVTIGFEDRRDFLQD